MSLNVFLVVFVSVCFSALAQLCFKFGVNKIEVIVDVGLLARIFQMVSSPFILLGVSLYGVGTLLWLFALKQIDLSLAYPFVGMSFILVFFMGVFILGEPYSPNRLIGTFIIVVGLIFMARA